MWRVQILGGFRVSAEGRIITKFRTRSADALFAYLAFHLGKEIRREALIELIWPGAETTRGQQSLRTALGSLRSTLGIEAIRSDRLTAGLIPDAFEVDAIELRRTLDPTWYGGRLLEGFDLPWVQLARGEIDSVYARAVLAEMARRPQEEAVRLGREALGHDPGNLEIRAKLRELDSVGSAPRSAPYILSSFVGRERELGEINRLLESNRLVTLTGMGGSGKTRIAAELWNRNRPDAWFISFADITDPQRFDEALRQGLHLPPSPQLSSLDQVTTTLAGESGLLVLDNLEQILPASSSIEAILGRCPNLKVVVTSRVGLNIENELVFQVGSMGTEPEGAMHLSESALLFQSRAKAVAPDFSINEANEGDVTELCRRLDGFPLSLEFAAARSRMYTPGEMLQQLSDRFEFLTPAVSGQGRRKASLLDALDWSFDRLGEETQALLCRLSVFEGGFTLASAASVCQASASDMQVEALLVSAWIERAASRTRTRFRLLESIRDYGMSLLTPGDLQVLRDRHAAYFSEMTSQCVAASFMADEHIHHQTVHEDMANIEAAWSWLRSRDTEAALEIVIGLNWVWILDGQARLGEARVKEALASVSDEPRMNLGRARHHCGNFLLFQGKFEEAEPWFRSASEVADLIGDVLFQGLSACQIGRVRAELSDFDSAKSLVDRAVTYLEAVGDDNWISAGHTMRCLIANRAGDVETALAAGRLAVEFGRRGGYRWGIASGLNELAMACHLSGDYHASIEYQLESIELKRSLGSLPSLALSLTDVAATYLRMGEQTRAKESMQECFRVLGVLNSFESVPRAYAVASQLLSAQGRGEEAAAALRRLREIVGGRRLSAAEEEAYVCASALLESHPARGGGVSADRISTAILSL